MRGSHTDYEDESLDVFPFFTAACYKGFEDNPDGFYAVYAQVFDQIAAEDIEFMDSPDEYENMPKFGSSTSDYESVVGPFYGYWQSYTTKKTYTWLCPHNISEIRDRRILREVEKETKKIAQKKRKERNDEVRALVAFVRKRDKRVQEYRKILEAKAEQNRLKQQQHRLAQLRKNQQEAQEMQTNQSTFLNVDHEEQLRQLEQAYGSDTEDEFDDDREESDNDSIVADDDYIDDLYCVACNKTFKNISSYENHESSKKHRENTERMKKDMQLDEEYANENRNISENQSDSEIELANIDSEPSVMNTVESKKKLKKQSKKSKKLQEQYHSNSENEEADISSSLADANIGNEISADEDNWSDNNGKKKKKTKNKKANKIVTENESEPNPGASKKNLPKIANSKAQQSTAKHTESTDIDHTCVTCNSSFESKNKLFAHLKKTNHGVYISK